MAILKIARMGHPVLRSPAEEIADPTSREIRRLVEDMLETLFDADGAGLAAPQVHVPRRLVIFKVPPERAGEDGAGRTDGAGTDTAPLTVLINPEIEILTEEQVLGWEGCLSVPGLTGAVPRYTRIRYHGLTPQGRPIEREAAGYHARVVQHECDHLDGILYPMRMTDLSLLVFNEELRHFGDGDRADRDGAADEDGAAAAVAPAVEDAAALKL